VAAGFGERSQEVRASQHDERPADERHEIGQIGTADAQQRQRRLVDGWCELGANGCRRTQLPGLERVDAPVDIGEGSIDRAKPRRNIGVGESLIDRAKSSRIIGVGESLVDRAKSRLDAREAIRH
jgi:hypothetical protein